MVIMAKPGYYCKMPQADYYASAAEKQRNVNKKFSGTMSSRITVRRECEPLKHPSPAFICAVKRYIH